jgi:hypothetical protein
LLVARCARESRYGAARDDHGDFQLNQLFGERGGCFAISFRETLFEAEVTPWYVAQLAKLLPKRIPPLQSLAAVEEPDDSRLRRGLRVRSRRQQRHESDDR